MTDRRRGDAHRLLLAVLRERAGGDRAEITSADSEAWASATFRGARHKLALRLGGEDAAERATRLSEQLDAIEFSLPGHLVADIALVARRDSADGVAIEIEALTVEDA